MKARCGQEDCDCGYVIEKLEALARRFATSLHYKDVHELPLKDCPYHICQEAREAIAQAKS